ncbi:MULTISPECIES: hypothetical protein [unclassified Endozoicomonas]|uniref:hypothetical protein n=1 Tax=unclassified Endozoicomonas TaxID=2644528 RepID=UPI003BB6F435
MITGVLLSLTLINRLQNHHENLPAAQAQRLIVMMTSARDQAVAQNRELGLSIDDGNLYVVAA